MRTEESDRDGIARVTGRWARFYLLVAVLAVVMMAVLWALTAAYNIRMPS